MLSTRLAEERVSLLKQCEETVSLKAEEAEQLKLQLEGAQQELLLSKSQVCFFNYHGASFHFDFFQFGDTLMAPETTLLVKMSVCYGSRLDMIYFSEYINE